MDLINEWNSHIAAKGAILGRLSVVLSVGHHPKRASYADATSLGA